MKLGMISLGCAKNLVDTERILGLASKYNLEITNKLSSADILMINTCGFIESAKKESLDTIFDGIIQKKKGAKLIVIGCLVERYFKDLKKQIPEVDYWFRLSDYDLLDEAFRELTKNHQVYKLSYLNRILTTPNHLAYLQISDGCNNNCTYCAIPLIRGKYHSRKESDIIGEAKTLVENGVKEISIIAQDTTRYGSDLKNTSLAKLTHKLSLIPDLKYIRLLYLYPDEINDELIEEIKTNDKIIKYFDIPIQHASNKILNAMGRRGNQAFIRNLINKIRSEISDVIIRTTLIVGFPGETKQDYEELKSFVKEIKFDRLGIFTYSNEEDTEAFYLVPKISEAVKEARKKELLQIQSGIVLINQEKRLGKVEEIVIDKYLPHKNVYLARSKKEAMDDVDGVIYVESSTNLTIGEYYQVLITKNLGYDLQAQLA